MYVSLVRDSAGTPSTSINDILSGPKAVAVSGVAAGTNVLTIDIPNVVLAAGTYHVVVETDANYKSTFSNGVTQLALRSDTAGSGANAYNGTIWSSSTGGLYYNLEGRNLDLLLRITASQTSALDGFAVFYDAEGTGLIISSSKNLERQTFNALTPVDEFTVTAFMPDPDLLVVYWEETGQSFVNGGFSIDGQKVIFPTNTFALGFSQTVTLRFDQTRGGSFDNSDRNANLLAANHLGSSDSAFDRSQPGRGILLRSPNGNLYEITIKDGGSGFDIYQVT
jgi:hypothetical protein